MVFELAGGDEAVIPAFAFVQHFGFGNAAREDDGIHREFFNAEMGIKEMDGKDEAGGEQRLIGMDNERDIDDPTGHEAGEKGGEPHDESRSANDGDTPEYGEVIEFFPIGPAVELRLGALTEEPLVVIHEVFGVLPGGNHGIGTEQGVEQAPWFEAAGLLIAQ